MTLSVLPGAQPGGLMPKHLNPRPCVNNPAWWWDVGDENNIKAIGLCLTGCPLVDKCREDTTPVLGMIRAGVPYGDDGKPVRSKSHESCVRPTCQKCRGTVADHHTTIAQLRAMNLPYRLIAERIGFSIDATRQYWRRYERSCKRAREEAA